MKRWRKAAWTFLITITCLLVSCVWAVKTRSGLVFEKDQYWKQILDNSPYVTKNRSPFDHQFLRSCQIKETGTLKGLQKQHVESDSALLGGDITETWHGPCYVEVAVDGGRKIIWGKKLVKIERGLTHSVHVTIE
ncbi:MAG: hypothetical protein WCI55_13690 [Armatimonadota bacterium]